MTIDRIFAVFSLALAGGSAYGIYKIYEMIQNANIPF